MQVVANAIDVNVFATSCMDGAVWLTDDALVREPTGTQNRALIPGSQVGIALNPHTLLLPPGLQQRSRLPIIHRRAHP